MSISLSKFTWSSKSNSNVVNQLLSQYGILLINDDGGGIFTIKAKKGSGATSQISINIKYNDNSTDEIFFISQEATSLDCDIDLRKLDFATSSWRLIVADTSLVETATLYNLVWKPEIIINKFHVYQSDANKTPFYNGTYLTIEGNLSFDLPNSNAIEVLSGNSFSTDFSPVGRYRFKVTDGVNATYSDYSYITNQGNLESYQRAKGGIEDSLVIDCGEVNLENASCIIETSILDDIDGMVLYDGDNPVFLVDRNIYFHMSPNGRGMGIGGIPMHGNYDSPALDIHWPTYTKQLSVNNVDMTLDDETINLWKEILGGGGGTKT